ncbi:MAG: M3 family metallopeptidase, partial [Acidobacteriota bacterium]|nr:M3 family metallopeptidase [Acidobacteriota bacterium]
GSVKSVDALVTELNGNASLPGKIRAANDAGKLRIENLSTEDLTVTGVGTDGEIDGTTGEVDIGGNDVRKNLVKQFNELRDQLVRLRQEFDRNVREGARTLTVANAGELAGLPPDYIAARKPRPDGSIVLTTNASDLQPVMLYAKSDDLRRRMLLESNDVAYPANLAVLQRTIETRAELARTLGFKDWATFDLSNRMAATPQNAAAFIDRIVAASAAKANADYQLILDRKRQDQPGATTVEAWQRRYYTELVRQSSYDFNSQSMRPYFSYERVRAGVFAVSGRLFGLEFKPAPSLPVWHPSVEPYEVFEAGRLVGRIYLDMHPRDGKAGGGATAATARAGIGGRQLPEVVLITRFPGGTPGDPGLMTFDQVTTFFHEFGHLVHAISSGQQQRWIGLTRVAERDFIEAPSQMMEEWVSDPATLATFATHYQTNEPIPAALIHQMRRANQLGRGYDTRQQMVFAGLSLSLHNRDPKDADAMVIYKDLMTKYLPTAYPEGSHFPGTFTQLSNPNYTASYYTYMWSLVIAKDLFSGFDKRDLLAPGPARRFRDKVLAQGGAKPAADLVRDFLGRPYSFDAWAAWLNQSTPAPVAP